MGQIPGKASLDASLDATMLVSFAAISPVLAGVGHLRVLSYMAAQRTTQMGIRIRLAHKETRCCG
jgi:hypothetical protein